MNRSIIIGAIIISGAILVNGFLERRPHVPPVAPLPMSQASKPSDHTIAVLPFTSLGSDAENSLAAAIQHEIVTRLTAQHIPVATVQEPPVAGQLLLGSVQRAGNHVRINIQLVDADSRVPHWAETYDRELTDVLALESEVAEAVAKSVAAKRI
jgi:TolB-like protein